MLHDDPAVAPAGDLADRLLDGLDAAQRRAVTTTAQPLCILAGAGSGKTRVLTRRIAYRVATGDADPRNVLALTFSRRAATELRNRLAELGLRDAPTAGTFHAVAYSQLRQHWQAVGAREPSLLDRKGRVLVRLVPKDSPLRIVDVAAEIEWAKARLVHPGTYEHEAAEHQRRLPVAASVVAELFERYEEEKRRRGLVDFDDLLARCADALLTDSNFAAAQRWRFRHLFVDEYQDVNPLQHHLLRAWLGDRTDLCVVGDPNQAIYRWNGADAGFLTDFGKEFPGATVVSLEHNHRSTPEVVRLAATALVADHRRPGLAAAAPVPATTAASGVVPRISRLDDEHAEAVAIARSLREHHRPGRPWSDQAVLVRTHGQTGPIEEVLRRARIPYRVRGAGSLLDRPGVREALRAARTSRAPLATFVADLDAAVAAARVDAEMASRAGDDGLSEAAEEHAERLDALEALVRLGHDMLVAEPEARATSFPGWLVATVAGGDVDGSRADTVDLVTFHASKGLEWKVVHVAGVEEGYVPSTYATTPDALDEERRLLHVALTRAEHAVLITWAARRTFGDRVVERSPSRWLEALRRTTADLAAADRPAHPDVQASHLEAARAALDAAGPSHEVSPFGAEAAAAELRRWRSRTAKAAGVTDAVVLPDWVLTELAEARPGTADALAAVPGLGRIKAHQYADELLALLHPDRPRNRVQG